jgi:hypothetical protein
MLRASLEETRSALYESEGWRADAQREAHATASKLAEAQVSLVAVHSRLRVSRRVAAVSASQSEGAHREAGSLEKVLRAAHALLSELVSSLHAILGSRAPKRWLDAASAHASGASSRHGISSDDVLAIERAVRKTVEDGRTQAQRLEARVSELALYAAVASSKARAGKRRAARGATAAAHEEEETAEHADDSQAALEQAQQLKSAQDEMLALGRYEQRAQAQLVSLRLALTAAHAELQAHRQNALGATTTTTTTTAAAAAATTAAGATQRPATAGGQGGGWASGVAGWELVELIPGLDPTIEGRDGSASAMPDSLLARLRGVPYRLTRVRARAEMEAVLSAALESERSRQLAQLLASGSATASWRPAAHAPSRLVRVSSAQLRRAPQSQPPIPSSVAVLRRTDAISSASPILTAAAKLAATQRPATSGDRSLEAKSITAEALRHERQLLTGELARVWG